MKGLLEKEFMMLWLLYGKNMLLITVIYFAISFVTGNPTFLFIFLWVSLFYTMGTISTEQYCHWDHYARTLPVDTKELIGAKYAADVLLLFVIASISMLSLCVMSFFGKGDLAENVISMGMVFGICLISLAVILPVVLKWGVEKVRMLLVAFWLLLFVIVMGISKLGIPFAGSLEGIENFLDQQKPWALAGAFALAGILACAISFPVGCFVYDSKKE